MSTDPPQPPDLPLPELSLPELSLPELPLADLPLADLPASADPGRVAGELDRRSGQVPAPQWAMVDKIARTRDLPLGAVLATAFAEVLRRWARRPEFTVAVAGRPVPGPAGETFTDRVRALPAGLPAWPTVGVPALSLACTSTAHDGGVELTWTAPAALFPAGVFADLVAAHRDLVALLGQDEDAWDRPGQLVALPAWQAAERAAANATGRELVRATLYGLVAESAARQPDAVAVLAADGTFGYRDLLDEAHRLANHLAALGSASAGSGSAGSAPDALVAVVLPRGRHQAAAVLGVCAAGAAYLPVDPRWPAARRAQLFELGRVRVAVTTPELRAELDWPAGVTVVTFADAAVRGASTAPPAAPPGPDDLAYVIFTSGSTGTPKGVMIDHVAAVNTILDINRRWRITPADRVLALSELSFDLSVYDVFGTLAAGAALVVPEATGAADPRHWSELVARHGVTVWNSVPALLRVWLDSRPAPAGARALRLVLLSGDWIPVALPDAVRALCPGVDVHSLGGATEASIWSITYPIGQVPAEWSRIPYGRPLANQTTHVLADDFTDCPVWTVGEIHIGGAGVARGYWADPDRTAERFVRQPGTGERRYRTGDLGRYLPGGDIEFLGRADCQVKINGFRIEPDEIAAALLRQPGVADALVGVGVNPKTEARQLVAHVVPAGAGLDPAPLRAALREVLPAYLVPHHYLVVERFPLSANGKVDRSALPSPWPADAGHVPPRDDTELALFGIWRTALGHDDFGVRDDFFELGGDSLRGLRIVTGIRERFGWPARAEDGLRALFDYPTIAELAPAVRVEVSSA